MSSNHSQPAIHQREQPVVQMNQQHQKGNVQYHSSRVGAATAASTGTRQQSELRTVPEQYVMGVQAEAGGAELSNGYNSHQNCTTIQHGLQPAQFRKSAGSTHPMQPSVR